MLGRMCIAREIPVSDVSSYFGVSRMTIYKWFKGLEIPRQKQIARIEEVLAKAKFSV
jgi:predicted DNA-binding transcriptional regulator AlpA